MFLSLGSNLGYREGNLRAALRALEPVVRIDLVSSVYETTPIGVTDQPAFLNVAVSGTTSIAPLALLAHIKEVERDVGRTVTYRWGPRVVDIDIVFYGDLLLDTPDLTIPHREMERRAFVLAPLAEIAPHHVHPGLSRTVAELSEEIGDGGVWRVGTL